jgi:ABC-2 type transport system permease protein
MISAVIQREWNELKANKTLLLTNLIVPVVLLAVATITTLNAKTGSKLEFLVTLIQITNPLLDYADSAGQVSIARFYFPLFLIIPAVLPLTFATTSIISEKLSGSLEAVLVTPITTQNLLVGKTLAFAIPPTIVTWITQSIFLIFVALPLQHSAAAFPILWVILMMILVPFIAVIAVGLSIIVSSKVNDIPAAQQIGIVLVLPILALAIAQIVFVGYMTNPLVYIGVFAAAITGALIVVRSSVMLFNRETITSSWK